MGASATRRTVNAPRRRVHVFAVVALVGAGLAGAKHWILGPLLAAGGWAAWMLALTRWIRREKEPAGVGPGDAVEVVWPESQRRAARAYVRVFFWLQGLGIVLVIVATVYFLVSR